MKDRKKKSSLYLIMYLEGKGIDRGIWGLNYRDSFWEFIFVLSFHVGWNGRKKRNRFIAHNYIKCGKVIIDCNNIKGLVVFIIKNSAIRFKMIELIDYGCYCQGHPPIKDSREKGESCTRGDRINWSIFRNLSVKSGIFRCIWVYFLISGFLELFMVSFCFKVGGAGGVGLCVSKSRIGVWRIDG